MCIDLIAFDLDGTTLNSNLEISERNRSALQIAFKQGIKLVPCTGRAIYELPKGLSPFIDEFGFSVFPYIITENGARVYNLPQKELLYSKSIPKETALAVLREGRKQLAMTYMSFGIKGAMDNLGIVWETEETRQFIRGWEEKWVIPSANLEELIEWYGEIAKTTMNFVTSDDYEKCIKTFSAWPGLALSSSQEKSLEIMANGVNKGEAVVFISRHSGIPMERVMAIGDNLNDLEMILKAGFGVAMGNAIPELKEKANWVTASNDDDGLAMAIEKVLEECKAEK